MNGIDDDHDDLENRFGARAKRKESESSEQTNACSLSCLLIIFHIMPQINSFTLKTRKVRSQNIVGLKGHVHTLRKIIWVPGDRYLDFLPLTLRVQGR